MTERDWTRWTGTERHGEGRDRTERDETRQRRTRRGGEGWDGMDRDGMVWRGTGRGGKGLDGTGWRGTELHAEVRDGMERDGMAICRGTEQGGEGRDERERDRTVWAVGILSRPYPCRPVRFHPVPPLSVLSSVPLHAVPSNSVLFRLSPSHPLCHSPTLAYLQQSYFLGKYRKIYFSRNIFHEFCKWLEMYIYHSNPDTLAQPACRAASTCIRTIAGVPSCSSTFDGVGTCLALAKKLTNMKLK